MAHPQAWIEAQLQRHNEQLQQILVALDHSTRPPSSFVLIIRLICTDFCLNVYDVVEIELISVHMAVQFLILNLRLPY